jgi:hypothetical protein
MLDTVDVASDMVAIPLHRDIIIFDARFPDEDDSDVGGLMPKVL